MKRIRDSIVDIPKDTKKQEKQEYHKIVLDTFGRLSYSDMYMRNVERTDERPNYLKERSTS